MEAPEAAADATGALAALQEDKLVDLTASMKLASRSLEPPGTASSLSLSDAGNEPPAGVRPYSSSGKPSVAAQHRNKLP